MAQPGPDFWAHDSDFNYLLNENLWGPHEYRENDSEHREQNYNSILSIYLNHKYEYKHGSELYIVYTFSKSINGVLFENIKDFIAYTKKIDWTEQYFSKSLYIKFSYWFDV